MNNMSKTNTDPNIDTFGQPINLLPHYNDTHREQIAEIADWMAAQNKGVTDPKKVVTQSWLARLARLNTATVNLVLGGKYPSPPDAQLRKLLDAIADQDRKQGSSGSTVYVKTGIYRIIEAVCNRASAVASFGVIAGYVGVGKTAGVKEYVSKNAHAYLIEAAPSMTVGVLLDAIMDALKIGISPRFGKSRSAANRFASIIEALKGASALLIIDEAETMSHRCLHELRRIRDMASVGIVLVGTEKLSALIMPEHGEFDQIRSRVCLWPATIKAIQREDADALSQSALSAQGEIGQDVLDVLWGYSKGSARMLTENLIPAIKDYGLAKGNELNVDLVNAIAKQVLNLRGV